MLSGKGSDRGNPTLECWPKLQDSVLVVLANGAVCDADTGLPFVHFWSSCELRRTVGKRSLRHGNVADMSVIFCLFV